MAKIRAGDQPVLLVVDMQNGVLASAWNAAAVKHNVAHVVGRARTAAVPVLWVQHTDDELVADTEAWQLVPELVPGPGEPVLRKGANSSFEGTSLDADLDALQATHVVLAGAATNWCIRATAYAALERGYDLTLVGDGHTTESIDLDGGVTLEAARLVDDLNVTMRWVAYPGRRNRVAKAAEVEFRCGSD